MNLKNYTVTDSQIEMIALLLIKQNGSTTNLDIKNQFRSSGFQVTQEEVSKAMTRLEEAKKFKSSSNGTYRTFTFGPALSSAAPKTYKSQAIIADLDKVYDGCWVVTDGVTTLYMHKTITRSKARTRFSRETGTHYNDVRCRRKKTGEKVVTA